MSKCTDDGCDREAMEGYDVCCLHPKVGWIGGSDKYCEHPYRCGHLARHDWDDWQACDELQGKTLGAIVHKGHRQLFQRDCPNCEKSWETLLTGSVEGYFKR